VYWLRRIPAETRFVVLVVFLALFQSILLSVFGLAAVRGERQQVAEQAAVYADQFLREAVAAPAQHALRDRAEEAWADPSSVRPDSLFTDLFRILPDGRILDAAGDPLYLPPAAVAAERDAAAREARALVEAFRAGDLAEDSKTRADLDFARRHPFYEQEPGDAQALLFAATPLYREPRRREQLLEARWIGLLNRVARQMPAGEVDAFLERVMEGGAGDPAFREEAAGQDRRAALLDALRREAPRINLSRGPALHPSTPPFYVRLRGTEGEIEALATDRARLLDVLNRAIADAKGQGVERPRIVENAAVRPSAPLRDLPGFFATVTLSDGEWSAQAGRRARFYWSIIGFSVAGILAGGVLTARAVMREVRLAKLKSDFVSNVSHELKTPLTSIRMFSEMLRSGKVTDEAERDECLKVIADESERLGTLIQRVLDLSRLQSRKRAFHFTVGPLRGLVEREAERFRRATGATEEEFQVRIGADLTPVSHDPEAFADVVSNLLSNAWKYSPRAERRVALLLGTRNGRVILAVEDNGPGVPPSERQKIFEEFHRADDLLTREVEGTGLGLSIARAIVRAHNGRIGFEERPGGGSRFVVLLPPAPASPAPPRPPERKVS